MVHEPIIAVELIKLACAKGVIDAVVELSTNLNSNLSQRNSAEKRGKLHLASSGKYLPDSVIGNFAYRMVRVLAETNQPPPQELAELLKALLKQDRPPSKSDRRYVQRLEAIQYLKDNPTTSDRKVAAQVGVSPSTVSRWKKANKL
jgi:hypothetical protein